MMLQAKVLGFFKVIDTLVLNLLNVLLNGHVTDAPRALIQCYHCTIFLKDTCIWKMSCMNTDSLCISEVILMSMEIEYIYI